MTGRRVGGLPRTAVVVTVLAAVAAFAAGAAMATLTIASSAENAGGAFESGSAITWWSPVTVAVDTIPSTVPTALSTSASSPTVLPATNGSFVVGTATASDAALRWDVAEKSAPASTELVLTFTFVNATTGAMTTVTGYVKTQTAPPVGTMAWSLFLDVGTSASVSASSEISQQCPSTGSCP